MSRDFPKLGEAELGQYHLTSHLIADQFADRGYSVEWLAPETFLVVVEGQQQGWSVTRSPMCDTFAHHAVSRKDLAATLLRRAGVQVAEGRAFTRRQREDARLYADELGWPLVVKPASGSTGSGVTVGVRSFEEFAAAWKAAGRARGRYRIVERQFSGEEARFLVVAGRCVAVAGKEPPSVVGDGEHTVAQLVDMKNEVRGSSPQYHNRPIRITPARVAILAAAGLTPDSVPADDEKVYIDRTGNLSKGAEAVDLTDAVDETYLEVAVAAAAAVPGLDLAGVDIMAHDLTRPTTEDNHIVLELNSWPGISGHHFPAQGEGRDVAAAIVDHAVLKARLMKGLAGEPRGHGFRG